MTKSAGKERGRGEEVCIFTGQGRDLQEYSHEEIRHGCEKQHENTNVPDLVRSRVTPISDQSSAENREGFLLRRQSPLLSSSHLEQCDTAPAGFLSTAKPESKDPHSSQRSRVATGERVVESQMHYLSVGNSIRSNLAVDHAAPARPPNRAISVPEARQ